MAHIGKNAGNSTGGISISGNILSKISFCDKECSNVNDNKVKSAIIEKLNAKFNIQVVSRDYNIINPNNLRIVSFHQHIITPYTNGNPYMLYLCKIDGVNCCIYIDKKLKDGYTFPKMHCVKYRFADPLFEEETVFSGELVKDNERRWSFLIDNILVYRGMNTGEKNIISRFELIHKIMKQEYTADRFIEICPLIVKKLFMYRDIRRMVEDFIPLLPYKCKGIVFYTLNSKCSNFAFLLPRDGQIEVKTTVEINDIVQERYPKLWEKKHGISQSGNLSGNLSSNIYIDSKVSGLNSGMGNALGNLDISNIGGEDSGISGIGIVSINSGNVVFKILKTDIPDIYNLYCNDNSGKGNIIKHGIALVPNIKVSHYLYNMFKDNPNQLDMRVECRFSKIFEKWTPIRFVGNEPYKQKDVEALETHAE